MLQYFFFDSLKILRTFEKILTENDTILTHVRFP